MKSDEFNNDCLLIRVKGSVQIDLPAIGSEAKLKKAVNTAFTCKQEGVKKFSFKLQDSEYIIDSSSPKDGLCSDLYANIKDDEYFEIEGLSASQDLKREMIEKLKKKRFTEKQPIYFYFCASEDSSRVDDKLVIDFKSREKFKANVHVDVVFPSRLDETLKDIYRKILTNVRNQLGLMKDMVLHFMEKEGSVFYIPQVFHFRLEILGQCFISICYPTTLDDEELIDYRKSLHQLFSIPTDRPYIRKGNRYKFPEENKNLLLINPHVGLQATKIIGEIYLVDGDYSYHHYMQNNIDDSGWGCAYRSLQTIISWFMHQGYIDIEKVPDHRKIQQTLVEVGDKETSFIGSRKWIGSQEVSYVLNQLYGIVSKIAFVSEGRELASKGSELKRHFQSQGTPVMIGGGVLAHTILGIQFNEDSGEISFLVLDPHYTGPDDLKKIQNGGWCGWKSPTFWDQNAFYNLCLPQKPNIF